MKDNLLKKTLAIILLIFILFWPVYVFFFKVYKEDKVENNNEIKWKGVITLWDYPRLNVETGSRYDWISNKIKKFERENPGVYIELETLDWQKGTQKLDTAAKNGNLPDIAPVGTEYRYIKKGYLENVGRLLTDEEKDRFKYQALRAVTYDEEIWGVPVMMTTYAMYLNLDIFRERGVEPPLDGNWTYEEFVEKMKKLTWDSDGDGDIDQYGFTSFIKPDYYNIWGIILSDGAEIVNDKSNDYSFYGKKAKSGLDKLVDLKYKYKVTPDDFGIASENQAWEKFYKEKSVAVYPTGSWAVRVLDDLYKKGEGFNFAVANYPIGDRRIPISLSDNVTSYGVFKQDNEEKLKMCVKFLKFITKDEYQKEVNKLGMFTVKRDVKDVYTNNNHMRKFEDALSYTKVVPKTTDWEIIDKTLNNEIKSAVLGKKSADKAIKDAKNHIEKAIK